MKAPFNILKEHGYFAKKELGQNFLIDPSSSEMIIRKACIKQGSRIIEIGSGLGSMTFAASKKADMVYGIEKDKRLIPVLEKEIEAQNIKNIKIIQNDILKTDIKKLLAVGKENYIIGNLPYNISSQIIFKTVQYKKQIKKCVFMLQKELAERIISKKGSKNYGRISVVLNYHAQIKKLASFASHLFYPKPKVDSVVIEITFKNHYNIKAKDEALFHEIVKASFGQRRKTIKNSIGKIVQDKSALEDIFKQADIKPDSRAENISTDSYVKITNIFCDKGIQKTKS
ncbi:MAG: ribosomal RNA small subunit methyltransferase A [Deltaproteobacteria bacterium]|nr:MAG: ribosomal RNA small subunit methyltransferase A [Deltaproteobacteria bacterium]